MPSRAGVLVTQYRIIIEEIGIMDEIIVLVTSRIARRYASSYSDSPGVLEERFLKRFPRVQWKIGIKRVRNTFDKTSSTSRWLKATRSSMPSGLVHVPLSLPVSGNPLRPLSQC
jgi:hypothetical protein